MAASRWNASTISRKEKKIKVITTEPNSSSKDLRDRLLPEGVEPPVSSAKAPCPLGYRGSVREVGEHVRPQWAVRGEPRRWIEDRVLDRVVVRDFHFGRPGLAPIHPKPSAWTDLLLRPTGHAL